jgi:GT2 family glycosyltransferase
MVRPGQISDTPLRDEAEQIAFFDAAFACAQQAETAAGAIVHDIRIGDLHVRLCFAGPALAGVFMPALAHLAIQTAGTPHATFHVWDGATTGVTMIKPPFPRHCLTDRGDIWGFASERIRSAFHWSEYSVNLMDLASNTGIFWVADAAELPYWSASSPLRTLFHWFLETRDYQLLHAACVGTEAGGVLITGKGGVGKSTTALTCLGDGLLYAGDDYIVVRPDPEPVVFSLYATAKLHHDHSARFPGLRELIVNANVPGDEKAVLRLYPARAGGLAKSMKLRAVMTPRFESGAETCFAPIEAASLRHAAAFTTMSQLPHAGRDSYDRICRILAKLPGLQLCLGFDLEGIPRAIRALLARDDPAIAGIARRSGPSPARERPLISVIIPVKNGARFVADAIGSIQRQAYPNLEIIVVDDGSTDGLAAAIASLNVDVRLFPQENLGPAEARNVGIRNAAAEFLAFLDVDDVWPEDRLTVMLDRLLSAPETGVVHGYSQLARLDPVSGAYRYVGNPRESFPYYIGAGLYRRSAFEAVGLFDRKLRFGEDTDWFSRAEHIGLPMEKLDLVTLLVRRHEQNMTHNRDAAELTPLLLVKKQIERRRAASGGKGSGA